MIAIIDYGVGNLFSLKSSLAAIGREAVVTGDRAVLRAASHVILPGVGAFGDAAARLRAVGMAEAVLELSLIHISTNPYNVNRLTLRAGAAALAEQDYYDANCAAIVDTRADTKRRLEALGFTCTDSRANFLFARHPAADGGDLYRRLKERGVLVRRFDAPRIGDYIRITIGTRAVSYTHLDVYKRQPLLHALV